MAIQESIVLTVREHLRDRGIELEPEEDIFTSGLVDSIAIMQTIGFLENTYGFAIPPQDLVPENFRTIKIMATYIEGQLTS